MAWIRIFRTRREAEIAKAILEGGGIYASISEDKFEGVPIQEFNVPARFRLEVPQEDIPRAAKYLASKLKKRRT